MKKTKTTGTEAHIATSEVTSTFKETKCCSNTIDKLGISFPNEDLNKLVEKINEIIEKKCH